MSVKISSYVWDGCAAHGVKGTKLLVMLRLADFSNDEGVCYPGIAKIARQIAAGRSTVTGAIGELENDGWLTRKERRKGQRNDSNIYTLNVAKLKAAALSADSHSPDTDKSESDHSKSDTSGSERSESGKNEAFDPPESGYDPSVNSKQDPSVLKPVGQLAAPADEPQEDSLKIDYEAVKKIFHDTLPELPQVLKVTEARRKVLRKLWKEYDLNIEKWGAYLRYIAKKCRWMLEDRPDTTSGKTWRKKDFDYLITEKCYLSVKEERANDLPKVEKVDTTARDDAYTRIVTQRRKPRNEIEEIAQKMAGSLGRMTDYDARRAWTGIWAQAVAQASENDLGRLAG
ncbi:TPA: helix-turn-helix domain-containing protein [Serratia fonticola]